MLLMGIGVSSAQKGKPGNAPFGERKNLGVKDAEREYSIIVYERQSNSPLSLDRELSSGRSGRFIGGIYDVYRSTLAGKVINLSTSVIGTGYNMVVKALNKKKENHANWKSSVEKESFYSKKLPMQTEISDFYRTTSDIGAMDPREMMFKGLGCRQYITYKADDGTSKRILVFEIACSLDDSKLGKQRIIHHGKFEIKVDSIRFNPYLCDLPNDSLTTEQVNDALRIPFDFQRRKNLTFRLNAIITSSWMNEAIELFKDQQLGQFQVEFTIPDSTVLDSIGKWKGYYTYNSTYNPDRENPKKQVIVSGECFIVPRSFVGYYKSDSENTPSTTPLWGTGQYRVDMQVTETCQMNNLYYNSDEKWKEEGKIIKRRKPNPSSFNTFLHQAKNEFDLEDHKWICTILDPVKKAIIVDEEKWVNHIIGVQTTNTTSNTNKPSGAQQTGTPNNNVPAVNNGSSNDNRGQEPQSKPNIEP